MILLVCLYAACACLFVYLYVSVMSVCLPARPLHCGDCTHGAPLITVMRAPLPGSLRGPLCGGGLRRVKGHSECVHVGGATVNTNPFSPPLVNCLVTFFVDCVAAVQPAGSRGASLTPTRRTTRTRRGRRCLVTVPGLAAGAHLPAGSARCVWCGRALSPATRKSKKKVIDSVGVRRTAWWKSGARILFELVCVSRKRTTHWRCAARLRELESAHAALDLPCMYSCVCVGVLAGR